MKYVLNAAQMQQCDENTMVHFHVPSAVLMERAAIKAVEELLAFFPDARRFLLVCGVGNNGGDGLAMARLLFLRGFDVQIFFPGKEERASVEAARQLSIVRAYGISLTTEFPNDDFDVYVDALFGIGLSREVGGIYTEVIDWMNAQIGGKMAVDIPSGIHADTGAVMGCAVQADLSVTFGFLKAGLLFFPGVAYAGQVKVADIGIDEHSLLDVQPSLFALEKADLALWPQRRANTNKGSYGKLLIIAGSKNMAGAAFLSARAAYLSGTGLVKVLTAEENRSILQGLLPEAILSTYDTETDLQALCKAELAWADAVVIGPGLGMTNSSRELVLTVLEEVKVPCVVDADGLNLLSAEEKWRNKGEKSLIFTPHVGELSRLCKKSVSEIKESFWETACAYAKEAKVILAAKDARTLTALPAGEAFVNLSGNNGMATAGAGDVLTGIIGGLLAQGVAPETAAPLGVFVHGLAGDAAAKEKGKTAMTASDLLAGLGACMKEIE